MSARDDLIDDCTEHSLPVRQQLRHNAPWPTHLERTGVLHVYAVTDPAATVAAVHA